MLGVTSTNVPLSPATFWPFAAANRQNVIATRARPRPGRGRAKPREGSEPRRADEGERVDIDRLCRRDIHIRHLTGQRRASSVCPFFSSSPLLVPSSASPYKKRSRDAGGRVALRATAERHSLLFPLFYIACRMSTSHEKRRDGLFRNFDASRWIFISAYSELHALRRHLSGASSRTPHPLAVPRLNLVVPRGRPHLFRTSMFGASALSAAPKVHGLPLSKATRKSRVPAARSTGTCALSVSHARALRASASRVPRSSARHLSGGRASPRGPGASLVRRVRANKYPPMTVAKKAFPAITPSHASASPPPHPDAGLRVRAMAAEEKSRIGLCGLAVMGQVRPSPPRDAPFGSVERVSPPIVII